MGLKYLLRTAALGLALATIYGCGSETSSNGNSNPPSCQETGCKGNRICVDDECVFPSEGEGEGAEGEGEGPICTPHESKRCSDDNVYWVNSCGSLEDVFQKCGANEYCRDAQCVDQGDNCPQDGRHICLDNNVYFSCGGENTLVRECGENEYCDSDDPDCLPVGEGEGEGPVCTPHAEKRCSDGNVYWVDSCGELEEISENCVYECRDNECINDRFQDLGNGLVRDSETNLMWQQEQSEDSLHYGDAILYCNWNDLDGYDDWRLPTAEELLQLWDEDVEICSITSAFNVNPVNCPVNWTNGFCEAGEQSGGCGAHTLAEGNEVKIVGFNANCREGAVLCVDPEDNFQAYHVRCVREFS